MGLGNKNKNTHTHTAGRAEEENVRSSNRGMFGKTGNPSSSSYFSPIVFRRGYCVRSAKMGEKKKKKNRDVREFRHAPAFRIIIIIYSFLYCAKKSDPGSFFVSVCVFAPLVPWIKKKKENVVFSLPP